jgi:predicted Holliday junction resolvase-like endonuclease
MDFLKILSDNFWAAAILMIFIISIVSIVLGILLEFYKVRIRATQKMLELRNEELRLQLKLQEQKKPQRPDFPAANFSSPKDSHWGEQAQAGYEMGYQQQG